MPVLSSPFRAVATEANNSQERSTLPRNPAATAAQPPRPAGKSDYDLFLAYASFALDQQAKYCQE